MISGYLGLTNSTTAMVYETDPVSKNIWILTLANKMKKWTQECLHNVSLLIKFSKIRLNQTWMIKNIVKNLIFKKTQVTIIIMLNYNANTFLLFRQNTARFDEKCQNTTTQQAFHTSNQRTNCLNPWKQGLITNTCKQQKNKRMISFKPQRRANFYSIIMLKCFATANGKKVSWRSLNWINHGMFRYQWAMARKCSWTNY